MKLMRFFSVEKIKKVVFSIGIDKSLRLNGFGSGFFRDVWFIVGMGVIEVVMEFFEKGVFFK